MEQEKDSTPNKVTPQSRIRAWTKLFLGIFIIWVFGAFIGPWIHNSVPVMGEINKVIEENDIDSTAYFYTGIEASYEGERYLREALELSDPNNVGLTIPFISGIVICIVILCLGYRYLPD